MLNRDLSLKNSPNILLAGQITGVEGYFESASIGMLAGMFAANRLQGNDIVYPMETTAMGALLRHLRNTETKNFQPCGINFGLFDESQYAFDGLSMHSRDREKRRTFIANVAVKNIQVLH